MTSKKSERGEFLFGLYNEKIRSFLYYLEKAKKTYQIEDVHQLRVNTKRIDAIYQLLENATALSFNAESHMKPVKGIFKTAGKLREGQVNLELLKKFELHPDSFMYYNVNLEKSQVKTIRDLKKAVRGFDKIAFGHTISMVEDYCTQIDKRELVDKMDAYIRQKATSIKDLLRKKQSTKNVHRMRKNLKAIDPVLSLLCQYDPGRFKNESLQSLKETALYIGDWHDRVMLVKSIKKIVLDQKDNKQVRRAFENLVQLIQEDMDDLMKKINSSLAITLKHILN
jgi:CHAD domain-containing protein